MWKVGLYIAVTTSRRVRNPSTLRRYKKLDATKGESEKCYQVFLWHGRLKATVAIPESILSRRLGIKEENRG